MTSVLKVDNIQNSSGTSALSIDSSGRVNQPQKPAFFLQGGNNNNRTVADDERFGSTDDGQAAFKTTGSQAFLRQFTYESTTGRLKPQVDGVYFIAGCFYQNENNDGRVTICVNGTEIAHTHSNSAVVKTHHVSTVLNLTTSDYVEFKQTNGESGVYYEGIAHTYLYGYMVG